MREYETIFLTRSDVSDSQTNQLLERVDGIIDRHGGTILQKKNWGRKELAYKVQKQTHGIYHYYNYSADSGAVSDLERALRLHELPMKFLTVKLADKVDVEARKKELAQQETEAARLAKESESKTPTETTEEAPAKEASAKEASAKEAPAKEASAKEASAKEAPAETKSKEEVSDA